jgi:Xaa-Pro aminopeptidase
MPDVTSTLTRDTVLTCIGARRENLVATLADAGLDIAVLTETSTCYWLGLTGTSTAMVTADGVRACAPTEVADVLAEHSPRPIGYESSLSLASANQWDPVRRHDWQPATALLRRLRSVKDVVEVALLRTAARATAAAIEEGVEHAAAGMAEYEVKAVVDAALFRFHGGVEYAFDPFVGAGGRSAAGWAGVSAQPCVNGALLVDMGIRYRGYCTDVARSAWIGRRDGDFARWTRAEAAVREAIDECLALMAPGAAVTDIAARCSDVLDRRGFAGTMPHYLGHGVGLEAHEYPQIAPESPDVLAPNMVVAIEPSIIIASEWGVRREDVVLVTDTGCEVLSSGRG